MDPAPVDHVVTPRPTLPRAIGVLSVAFGLPLFLCGLTCLKPVAPTLAQFEVIQYEPEVFQHMYEQRRNAVIDLLKGCEESAKAEADKLKFRKQREELEAKTVKIVDQVDQKVVNHGLERMTWYLWADVVTGAILNLLMLASGIGLIQIQEWARKMAVWVAFLKIVRLVALAVFLFVVVVPPVSKSMEVLFNTDLGKVMITQRQLEQAALQPGTGPPPPIDPRQLGEWYKPIGNLLTVLFTGLSLIFPTAALIVLTRPSAKAACETLVVEDAENTPAGFF